MNQRNIILVTRYAMQSMNNSTNLNMKIDLNQNLWIARTRSEIHVLQQPLEAQLVAIFVQRWTKLARSSSRTKSVCVVWTSSQNICCLTLLSQDSTLGHILKLNPVHSRSTRTEAAQESDTVSLFPARYLDFSKYLFSRISRWVVTWRRPFSMTTSLALSGEKE